MSYVCDETDYLISKFMEQACFLYEQGYKPVVLVVSRDIFLRIYRNEEFARCMFTSSSIKTLMGFKLHVSPILLDGGFMLLTNDDLMVLYQYEEILKGRVFNINENEVKFDIRQMTAECLSKKTNLLDGFEK
jgi:hypothetical protein